MRHLFRPASFMLPYERRGRRTPEVVRRKKNLYAGNVRALVTIVPL